MRRRSCAAASCCGGIQNCLACTPCQIPETNLTLTWSNLSQHVMTYNSSAGTWTACFASGPNYIQIVLSCISGALTVTYKSSSNSDCSSSAFVECWNLGSTGSCAYSFTSYTCNPFFLSLGSNITISNPSSWNCASSSSSSGGSGSGSSGSGSSSSGSGSSYNDGCSYVQSGSITASIPFLGISGPMASGSWCSGEFTWKATCIGPSTINDYGYDIYFDIYWSDTGPNNIGFQASFSGCPDGLCSHVASGTAGYDCNPLHGSFYLPVIGGIIYGASVFIDGP